MISLARKPLRALQVALPAPISTRLVGDRVAVQDYLRDFLPVRPFGPGVEKPQIGHEMPLVIAGDLVACRCLIIYIGVEFDGVPIVIPLLPGEPCLRCAPANGPSDLVIGEFETVTRRPHGL